MQALIERDLVRNQMKEEKRKADSSLTKIIYEAAIKFSSRHCYQ